MVKIDSLSPRERQIMHVLYRLGEASARDVMDELEDSLSDSSVRTFLRKLENKGYISHKERGLKYIYCPVVAREKASLTALSKVVKNFFEGSSIQAANSLRAMDKGSTSEAEIEQLERLLEIKKRQLKQ